MSVKSSRLYLFYDICFVPGLGARSISILYWYYTDMISALYRYYIDIIQRAAERRSRHRAWPKKQKNAIQKTTKKALKSIQNQSKTDQKSINNRPKSRSGGILEASWGVLGRLGSILGCLGRFRAVLMESWEYLEASRRRLGVVLEASWSRLEDVLDRLGASCGRFGSVLEVSCVWFSSQSGLN